MQRRSGAFIDIRLNAGGLPGIYLQEHLKPYQDLDELYQTKPRGLLVIGDWLTRLYLARSLGVHSKPHRSVALSTVGPCVVFDCELHCVVDSEHYSVRAGPCRSGIRRHLSPRTPSNSSRISWDIYCRVLSHFSDVALLFVPDFDGIQQIVEFLSYWVEHGPPGDDSLPYLRFLLVHQRQPAQGEVRNLLRTFLASRLAKSDPTKACTAKSVDEMIDAKLRITDIAMDDDIHRRVTSELGASFRRRNTAGFGFGALHYRSFLQIAVRGYARDPSQPFSFVTAARCRYVVPPHFASNMASYLKSTCSQRENVRAAASSLVMDAYPAQMHRFPPKSIFRVLYKPQLEGLGGALRVEDSVEELEEQFIELASKVFTGEGPLSQHRELLEEARAMLPPGCPKICSFCILQNPVYSIRCGHYFCETCIMREGRLDHSSRRMITSCPLCRMPTSLTITVQPPTGGRRSLKLGDADFDTAVNLFSDLRRSLCLTSVTWTDIFDMFQGTGTGTFLLIGVFLQGWEIDDCKHHSKNIRGVKITKRKLTFGKNLTWDFDHQLVRCDVEVDQDRKGICARAIKPSKLDIQLDITSTATPVNLVAVSSQLIASLFYIELALSPNFYDGAEKLSIFVRCRLPAGRALRDLVYSLKRQEAQLFYRGTDTHFSQDAFCTADIVRSVGSSQPFCRIIHLEISSHETEIDVGLVGTDGLLRRISGCPYSVEDIMKDQGLDSYFGWRTYSQQLAAEHVMDEALPHSAHLLKELRKY